MNETHDVADLRDALAAVKRLGRRFDKKPKVKLAISSEEMCALGYILARDRDHVTRLAELGTYTGYTANLMADLSRPDAVVEIYDMFEHNETSLRRLRKHPAFDPNDFYEVWRHNTEKARAKLEVHRGNLLETKDDVDLSLDLLFVDIVKHPSIVNAVVDPFYRRLRVGGWLLHQDYFHWQSPWLVYQMELLDDAFALVGDFGNNMSVYVKVRELTPEETTFDYVDGLTFVEKYECFDRAIARYTGARAGLLSASKLRLSLDDPTFDSDALHRRIHEQYAGPRVRRYADAVMKSRRDIGDKMW